MCLVGRIINNKRWSGYSRDYDRVPRRMGEVERDAALATSRGGATFRSDAAFYSDGQIWVSVARCYSRVIVYYNCAAKHQLK